MKYLKKTCLLALLITLSISTIGNLTTVEASSSKTRNYNMKAVASLGGLLMEFESNVQWSAVEDRWKKRRGTWVNDCRKAKTAQEMAFLLAEFESNIKWTSVDEKWKERREGWLRNCKEASSMNQVAKLLLEFESHVKWSAVAEKWKKRRDSWGQDVSRAN